MRAWALIAIACVLCISGCAAMIARSGTDLSVYRTPEDVRYDYGEPIGNVVTENYHYEEFRSRRKVSEGGRAWELELDSLRTLGLAEFVQVPLELFRVVRTIIIGQTVHFYYDD